jgi:hypothetical protein
MTGLAKAKSIGYAPFLMTLTFPHGSNDPLQQTLDTFQKALTSFKNSKLYKGIMKRVERLGSVRSLEVTWGQANGWHPHTHDLVFCKLDLAPHLDDLKAGWFKALKKVKLCTDEQLNEVLEHGLDIRDGTYAAEYVAKFGREAESEGWGLSGELTRSHAKLGLRAGRFTPFQLLQLADLPVTTEEEKKERDQARDLFRDFSLAFEGKRMLSYSPGLKTAIEVGKLDDDVLASMDTPMPQETKGGYLSVEDFHEVVKRGAVGELLHYAARYLTNDAQVQDDLDDWIGWLKSTPDKSGGALRKKLHFGGKGYQTLYKE